MQLRELIELENRRFDLLQRNEIREIVDDYENPREIVAYYRKLDDMRIEAEQLEKRKRLDELWEKEEQEEELRHQKNQKKKERER